MEEEGDRPREQISAMMFRVRSIDLDEFKNSFEVALGYRKPSITKKNILDSKLSKKEDIKINKPKIVEKVEAKTFRQIDYSVLRKADNVEDYINMMYDFSDINFGKEANFDDEIVMQHIDERKYRDSLDKEAFSLDCFKTYKEPVQAKKLEEIEVIEAKVNEEGLFEEAVSYSDSEFENIEEVESVYMMIVQYIV